VACVDAVLILRVREPARAKGEFDATQIAKLARRIDERLLQE